MNFADFDSQKYIAQATLSQKKIKVFAQDIFAFLIDKEFKLSEFISTEQINMVDGLLCLKATAADGLFFYICVLDPNIRGGTFSANNLILLNQFLNFLNLNADDAPFLFLMNSGGVRLTQKRTIFNAIWGVVPKLFILKKHRSFFSMAHELCLGASAVFFAQAHFRISTSNHTLVNLTGPGVIKSFFGESENFNQYASAIHQFERHLLIQEIAPDFLLAMNRVFQLVGVNHKKTMYDHGFKNSYTEDSYEGVDLQKTQKYSDFLNAVSDVHSEIMPHYSGSGACFMCQKNGLYFGLLINPLDHPVNSISVATIEKYTDALILFKALKLPLLNVTDSPGGDPRRKNSDQNIIQKSLQLIEACVDYPYPKVGLIVGRCFGGSGLFSLPSVHGSLGLYALEKSKMGAVSDNIIDQLVQGNIANNEEWQTTKLSHKADLSDLVETNNLVKIIKWDQLSEFTDHLLAGLKY